MIEIDPTVDFVCKMLLGNPAHSRLTIHFLNAVLRTKSPIVEVEYLNPFVLQEFELDKLAILDILACDDQGRRLNIEVQRTSPGGLPERLVYYASTQLVEQIQEGEGYHLLRPSIGICLLNARLFPKLVDYHQQFRLRTQGGLELTNCLEIHTLELPKYRGRSDNREVYDPLDQWMDFFCNAKGSTPEVLKARLPSSVFGEAIGVLEMISKTPEQRRYYDARMKWERDENTRIALAKAEMEKAVAAGEARGRLEGKFEMIHLLQEVLGEPLSDAEELQGMSLIELSELVAALQARIIRRDS
jgi:predicted transposase/invertase (TIGR01784 family)